MHAPDDEDRDRGVGDGRVLLELELDPTSLDHVEPHADCVALTGAQARTLADALYSATDSDGRDGSGENAE